MDTTYEDLAARAERGDLIVKPGTIRHGAAAAADAQRLLMDATGATTPDDAATIAVGRPSLGATAGASPVVRARVPQALKDRLTALAARQHLKESDIVREALTHYLATTGGSR